MPAWINSPSKEKAWKKAKKIVSQQRKKPESGFSDRDWGLVTRIAQGILNAGVVMSHHDEGLIIALANVEQVLEKRKQRKSIDASMPPETQDMVLALSSLTSVGSEAISALRYVRGAVEPDPTLAAEVMATTRKIKVLLRLLKKTKAS